MSSKDKEKSVPKDAKTGRFVSSEYAEKHPATTYTQTVPVKKK
jgi:hypothetical protein